MSKKFKFPPIPARRCPDRPEQENTVRVRPVKKVTPEVETFTDDDIEVEFDGNAAFLIRLTDPAEGIGKIDFSGKSIDEVISYKKELEKELEEVSKDSSKSELYIESMKDRINEADDHISKISNTLEILANGKIRIPEQGAVEFRAGSRKALALYVLYIKHTGGVNRKDPSVYKDELTDIFKFFWGYTDSTKNEIENLTTISEKRNPFDTEISKLRKAFYKQIGKSNAEKFLPHGKRGEAKRLDIDRITFTLPKGL